jgi:hypothetical protein
VITARSTSTAAVSALHAARGRLVLHVADILLPVSLLLWTAGIVRTNVSVLGPYGLLPDLPIIFYAGVALLVVSAAVELSQRKPSKWRMGLHAVALVAMLYGTAPLLYPEGRYSWLYKTVGVVQYVNANGHLNISIDIYQNWPGFFALAAWFTKVAGLGSPLAYAKWAQLFYELAALPLLYLIYEALKLTNRQRWVAILLYSASNWIGQDYFSPQATGTVLSLGIMAMAMRWLYTPQSARLPGWRWVSARLPGWRGLSARLPVWHWLRVPAIRAGPPVAEPRPPGRRSIAVVVAVLLVYSVLTFTHELSPYIVAIQLGALGAVGALRPRWLPLALVAIAACYLVPHWSYVNSHFGLLKAIGDIFKNVTPPAFKVGASPSQHVIEMCSEALSLGLWALAGLGAWLRRRAGQDALALVLLAFSPVVLLVVQAYGNEGILRVFLFSLPWSAALGACALLPRLRQPRRNGADYRLTQGSGEAVALTGTRRRLRALRSAAGLGAALMLFFPAFFGDDGFNVLRAPEVMTISSFLAHAPGGTVYVAIGHGPFADTSRYNEFPLKQIFGFNGLLDGKPATPEIAGNLARGALKRPAAEADKPAYVIVAPSMIAYSQAYQTTAARNFSVLLASLARSPSWKLVSTDAGTVIYKLAPISRLPGIHG